MRVSEAMRLGAAMKPQAFGRLFTHDGDRSCAVGAVDDAFGGHAPGSAMDFILGLNRLPCPECHELKREDGLFLVAHLNDTHKWSRERIADFCELHEALPEPSVVSPELTVKG